MSWIRMIMCRVFGHDMKLVGARYIWDYYECNRCGAKETR